MNNQKESLVLCCSETKANWLQKQGKVRDPYHGAKMFDCEGVADGENHVAHNHERRFLSTRLVDRVGRVVPRPALCLRERR